MRSIKRDLRSIKRDLVDLCALCAMTLALALVLGSPFVGEDSAVAQDQAEPQKLDQAQPQQQPDHAQPPQTQSGQNQAQNQTENQAQNQAQTGTFTGIVVKNGSDYMLRDSSGAIFKLDDAERAKPFEGKTVKVTGQLDEQAKVIHVESIEGAEA